MTLTREATWARTGTNVEQARNIKEALEKSNLDYTVKKENIYTPDGYKIPNRKATVVQEGLNTIRHFGIVGDNYNICQNEDAFEFVNYINEDLKFVRAGETRTGLVYVIAALPETHVLEDGLTPYVIFQNGHNGKIPVQAAISPLRILCQNQFNMAFKKADNRISIRHASTMGVKMENAQNILKQTSDYMERFKIAANELFNIKIAHVEKDIIDSFYEIDSEMSESKQEKLSRKRLDLLHAYRDEDDNQNFRGTAWGMINAYTDVLTHQEPSRYTDTWEESKFMKVTFDPSLMQKFVKHVKTFA